MATYALWTVVTPDITRAAGECGDLDGRCDLVCAEIVDAIDAEFGIAGLGEL